MKRRVVTVGLFITLLVGFILPVIAGEYTVFGPHRFERATGKPTPATNTFTSPVVGAAFALRVQNGDAQGQSRVSSGNIALNGTPVASPSDFSQQVGSLERTVPLAATNTLSVQLASQPGSYLTVTVVGEDNTPPQLSIIAPDNGAVIETASVDVSGTVSDETPVSLSVNGISAVVTGETFHVTGIPLQFGPNTLIASATDLGANTASYSITVTRKDLTPPQLTITAPADASITEAESLAVSGTVIDSSAVTITVNGVTAPIDGETFAAVVPLVVGANPLTVVATDSWGNAATAVVTITRKALRPPVEPQPQGTFGEQYQDLIPADTQKTSYDPKRFSLITGEVKGFDGQAISGVTVSVGAGSCALCHGQEYGTVKTDGGGKFTIPVEGGSTMTVTYQKPGLIPSHRQVYVPWNDTAITDTVQLLAEDTAATTVTFDGNPATVVAHRSTPVSDEFGTRSATLVFSGDNKAYEVDAGGSVIRELSSITTRATEFVTPESMPAALPPTSAYTYCAEFGVDGVQRVKFAKPVIGWVDNFLGFDVGEAVPVGYYDRDRGVWVPSENGKVVRLLDLDGNGSVDALDADGDNLPNDLNGDGAFLDEVKGLTDPVRYLPGATFWRFSVTHFTPWDCNWPYGPPLDAIPPNPEGAPVVDQQASDEKNPCDKSAINSFVEDRSRIFHEDIPIPGTDMTLHYASNRTKGYYPAKITVPASGATVPLSLKRIIVRVEIAGRSFEQNLPALPNQRGEVIWDGLDSLGKQSDGSVTAHIDVGFVYGAFYYGAGNFSRAFASAGSDVTRIPARMETITWRRTEQIVNAGARRANLLAEGWSLSSHHALSLKESGMLYLGDGKQVTPSKTVIGTFAGGTQGYGGDGGPAEKARLYYPYAIAVDAAGNVYIADTYNYRVRKVDAHGIITTVAGNGTDGYSGDGGPAIQAGIDQVSALAVDATGNLYIIDWDHDRVRKVDTNGIITTVAGNGNAGDIFSNGGDGGLAIHAELYDPTDVAVDAAGNLYILCLGRVRKVDTAGIITTVAGTIPGSGGVSGGTGRATQISLARPMKLAVDTVGNLYITEGWGGGYRVRKVDSTGIMTTVAGTGSAGYSGDGGPAVLAKLYSPASITVDAAGNLYIVDNYRVRKVDTAGIITTVAGNGTYGYGGDGGPAVQAMISPTGVAVDAVGFLYVLDFPSRVRRVAPIGYFSMAGLDPGDTISAEENGLGHIMSSTGQHKKTVDLDTGVILRAFGYDTNNNLISVTDRFGNVTTINRDSNGVPTSFVSSNGLTTGLTIDANNHLAAVTYQDGSSYSFEYTSSGLMTAEVDPKDNRFEHVFDTTGRLTDVTDPEAGHWKYTQSLFANGSVQVQKTTGEGNATTYLDRTDSTGAYTTTITGPNGGVTTFTSSADSLTETSALSCGMSTVSKYNLDPKYKTKFVKEQTESTPAGKKRLTLLDKTYLDTNADKILDRITDTITVNGKVTTLVQDVLLAKKEATSSLGRKVTAFYDRANLLTKRLSVSGLQDVTYTYDAKGRMTLLVQGERQTAFAYTDQGFLASATDPEQRTTSYDTDVMGRVEAIHRPDGSSIGFEYDNNGNMTVLTNPSSVGHAFAYNGNDYKTGYQTPQSGSYRYTYDKDRRLTEILFPSGRSIVNLYDKDRLSTVITPEGPITLNYLCATKLGSMSKGGETLTYTYDGKLVTAEKATGTLSQNLTYAYNNDFAVTGFTYAGATVSYLYDNDGLLTGAGSFTIARDAANGLPRTVSGGTYSLSRSFNGYGEIDGETTTIGGVNRFAYSLSRTPAGRISAKTETIGGAAANYTYTYDDLGRLLTVTKDGALVEEYRYDGVGRRTYVMNAASGIDGKLLAYSDEDHLLTVGETVYQHDLDGFLTTKTDPAGITAYTYSSRGELLKAILPSGKVIEYLHDPQGRRIAKKVNGVITEKYLWQGLTRLLAVYNASNALVMRFQYADGRMPVTMTKGAVTYRLGYDQVGSLRIVTDSAGAMVKQISYDSFGNILADSNPTFAVPFGFAGGLHDRDVNLVRFGFRDYDPETGRWTAKDPIGFAGGDVDVWGYVLNNPVNWTDPLGLWSFTFGGYAGPGFEISSGVDNGIPFLTGRIGLGLGGGFSWDPNGKIPGPAIKNPCEGGAVLAVSGAVNFNAGPISANLEKGDARNYSNKESSFYGGMGYSFGGEIGESMKGIKAGASIGTSLTLYGEL